MQQIMTHLLIVIEQQKQIINFLLFLLIGKSFKPKPEKCDDVKYAKLSVDPLPIFGKPKISRLYDWRELVQSKNIKPIRRRGDKIPPEEAVCPYCGAPHEFIYDNDGGRGSFGVRFATTSLTLKSLLVMMNLIARFAARN